MKIIYNIGIHAYAFLLFVFSFWHPKAKLWVVGRRGIFQNLKKSFELNSAPVAWFHCASLGEFEQARPVLETFKTEFPEYKILLTFFSPSGYEIRRNYSQADWVFYLPIDTYSNAARFVAIVKPKITFFVKYEFWYHYLKALKNAQVVVISFSSIFRQKQIFFQWYGGFYLGFLKLFDQIFVQNGESKKLLLNHGILQVEVAGDTRFDRVCALAQQIAPIAMISQFKASTTLWVMGSTWPDDITMLLSTILKYPEIKIIIAPHEISEKNIQQIETISAYNSVRYSLASAEKIQQKRVLIIDNIGMLSSLYQYADYAYIGGGFGKGIHNTLEAATFGMPIFIGPKYKKFQEAVDLVALNCAYVIQEAEEFETKFNLIRDNKTLAQIKTKTLDYVANQLGATARIINYCKQVLP